MNKINSIEAVYKTNLTNQTKFRLDEVSKIEHYFIEESNQRKSCSKKLSKYVAAFDYIDKILIVLSATSGGVSIILFTSIVGAPIRIASASLTLAKSKLNSTETLVLQAFIDVEISHEEFITILKEKGKYEKMKDNLRSVNEKYKIIRLSSVKSKTKTNKLVIDSLRK